MNILSDVDLGLTCDGNGDVWRVCTGHMTKCTGQASYVVTGHFVDHCDDHSRPIDPQGNWGRVFCPQCTAAILQSYGQMFGDDEDEPVPFRCRVCGKVFHNLHEVIQVDHLIKGVMI